MSFCKTFLIINFRCVARELSDSRLSLIDIDEAQKYAVEILRFTDPDIKLSKGLRGLK